MMWSIDGASYTSAGNASKLDVSVELVTYTTNITAPTLASLYVCVSTPQSTVYCASVTRHNRLETVLKRT